MSFKDWIEKYKDHDTIRGDLARDILRDTTFPADIVSVIDLTNYMRSKSACYSAIQAGKRAWNKYQESAGQKEDLNAFDDD